MTVRWTILADWGGQASYPGEVKAVGWGEGAPRSCVISCDLAQCVEILTPQVPELKTMICKQMWTCYHAPFGSVPDL